MQSGIALYSLEELKQVVVKKEEDDVVEITAAEFNESNKKSRTQKEAKVDFSSIPQEEEEFGFSSISNEGTLDKRFADLSSALTEPQRHESDNRGHKHHKLHHQKPLTEPQHHESDNRRHKHNKPHHQKPYSRPHKPDNKSNRLDFGRFYRAKTKTHSSDLKKNPSRGFKFT